MVKGRLLALGVGVVVSAAAVACAAMAELKVNQVVEVGFMDLEYERWEKISTALWAWYGDQYKDVSISSVNVPVRHCAVGICSTFEKAFAKPCGRQLGAQAWIVAELERPYVGDGGAGGGLGGGGGIDPGGGGFGGSNCTVHPKTGQACSSVGGGAQLCETYDASYVTCG